MPIVKRADSYRWTVRHPIGMKHGVMDFFEFDVEFKSMPNTQVIDITARALSRKLANEEFVDLTMVGWYEMTKPDGAGAAVVAWPFSRDAVIELCELYPGMDSSLVRAFFESVTGAPRKN